MSNWQDPDWRSGVQSGVESVTAAGKDRPFWDKLLRAVKDIPNALGSGGFPPRPEEGGEGPRPDLGREIGEFTEEFRESGVPNPTGEGPMDVGREDFGTDVPEGGTPRMAPSARPEGGVSEVPEEQAMSPVAELDYILESGDPNDMYSRTKRTIGESIGQRDVSPREAAEIASAAYEQTTGRNPRWTEDDLYQAFTDPTTIEAILVGL